jgi:hypothetical protein
MNPATRAILAQLQFSWVVPLVLVGGVSPLLALAAGEMDNNSSFSFLCHF